VMSLDMRIALNFGTYQVQAYFTGREKKLVTNIFRTTFHSIPRSAAFFSRNSATLEKTFPKPLADFILRSNLHAQTRTLMWAAETLLERIGDTNFTIPQNLIQIWSGGDAELEDFQQQLPRNSDRRAWFGEWREGCINRHPNWNTSVLWDSPRIRSLMKEEYPWLLDEYDAIQTTIKKMDVARLLLLFHFGGIYLDIDFECIGQLEMATRIPEIGTPATLLLGLHRSSNNDDKLEIQNAMIGARRFHPFIWLALHVSLFRCREHPDSFPLLATGPRMLTELLSGYSSILHDGRLLVHSPEKFYPANCMAKDDMLSDQKCILARNCSQLYEESIAVHHYASSWHHDPAFIYAFKKKAEIT
jgi:mannosyltransferase OCH1-like enzyme